MAYKTPNYTKKADSESTAEFYASNIAIVVILIIAIACSHC